MSILKIRFQNIWHPLSILTNNDNGKDMWGDLQELISWSKTELTNGASGYTSNIHEQKEAKVLSQCDEVLLNFNVLSFIDMLNDEQKELLLRQISKSIGYDKACSIIYDQEQYEIKLSKGEYDG